MAERINATSRSYCTYSAIDTTVQFLIVEPYRICKCYCCASYLSSELL